jgi:ABC-2 type transport system ATP-binding protein
VAGATIIAREGRRVAYRFGADGLTASDLIARVSAHFRISDLSVREPEIEATIRRIYEERLLDT